MLRMTAAELKRVAFKATPDRMLTLGELCDLVAGRVTLVIELKSRFDGDRSSPARTAEVLAATAARSRRCRSIPDQCWRCAKLLPDLPRGIVAERHYDDDEWNTAAARSAKMMLDLRHALPHAAAFPRLPGQRSARRGPVIARNIFGCRC